MDTDINAIQFITIKEDGALEVSLEAIELLSSLKNQKIAIASINGPPKQSKTAFLNAFHESISFNTNAPTEGMWLWNSPIELANGVKLLVMDTQGLDKNANSQKMFKLSILISTCFIYKTTSAIDSSAMEFISYFTEDANKIKIHDTYSSTHLEQLADYFPHLVWLAPHQPDKEADIYLDENISANMKKTFLRRNCMFVSNDSDYVNVVNFVKASIKTKTIDTFNIDGETLFGIVQNYIDIINDEEQPPSIYKAMENVLLSKGKNISENSFDNFKLNINKALNNKYPTSLGNIYKTYNDLLDKETIGFCDKVTGTLTVKQSGEYLTKLYARTRDELVNIFDLNKDAVDEWLDMMYKEIKASFVNRNVNSIDEMKMFFGNYVNDLYTLLNKFTDMPGIDDVHKNIISVIVKIYSDFVRDKFITYADNITDTYSTISRANIEQIETLSLELKKLTEQLNESYNSIDKKNTQASDLNKTNMELESKYEKLLRDMKTKEKEYLNNINIEVQKYQKNEEYYQHQIKEKENTIITLENKIAKLTKDLGDNSKEYTNKITELNKENVKLNIEIERLKGEKRFSTSASLDKQGLNLQALFKGIQSTLLEFKESVDKLDRDNENVFKRSYLETSAKDIEHKSREWINEIRSFREEQMRNMNDNYEKIIKKAKDEIEELNFEITKKNYELNEQLQLNKTNVDKINEHSKKIAEMTEISESKDKIIKAQSENISLLDTKISDYNKTREDLELKLNDSIVRFKVLEDDLENIIRLLESAFTRKKDKFEKDVTKLSPDNQDKVLKLAKQFKFIK